MDFTDNEFHMLIKHMPESTFKVFREYVYSEASITKMRVAAISRDTSENPRFKSAARTEELFEYARLLEYIKSVCLEIRA